MGIIVDRGRIVFVHLVRTGGTSIDRSLRDRFAGSALRLEDYEGFPAYFNAVPEERRFGIRRPAHAPAAIIRDFLGAETWERAESLAVVRNPWDLSFSVYSFIRNNRYHPHHQDMQSLSFEEFVDSFSTAGKHCQFDMVSDQGKPLVRHVIHFDRLKEDYATLANRLGFDGGLDHLNQFTHRDFREVYTPRTKALVAERFARDIDRFGFTFPD